MRVLLCLGILSLFVPRAVHAQRPPAASEGESYAAPARILAFADFLRERGDFSRAVSEYQRYLFSPASESLYYAHFQLGRSLLELDDPDRASAHFLQAAAHAGRPTFRDSATVSYLAALLVGNRNADVLRTADTLHLASPVFLTRLYQIQALAHLREGAWEKAGQALSRIPPGTGSSEVGPNTAQIAALVSRQRALPRKSPALAGVLSAVVPGTGKLYAGRLSDGLYSMLLIGATSWFAYEGFRDKGTSSVRGWLFGSIGVALYAGNVYGSVVAVRLYNASHEEALEHDIRAQISISTPL